MRPVFELTEKNIEYLLKEDIPIKKLNTLTSTEFLIATWKLDGYAILFYLNSTEEVFPKMSFKDFLSYCSPCGGDWGQMVLTGIKELYPTIYNMIPEDMGVFAFDCLVELLNILNIDTAKSGE